MAFKDAQDVFCVGAQARIPVLTHSPPGHGKTTFIAGNPQKFVNGVAAKLGYHDGVYTLLGSIIDRTDVAGIPVRVEEEGIFKYLPHGAIRQLRSPFSMLFLDELTGAPPDVQNALLRVVLEQVMGDVQLRCYVAAACNPPSMAAGGNELSHAMNARFMHLEWQMDAATFAKGTRSGWKDVYKPPMLPSDWMDLVPKWNHVIAKFIEDHPDELDRFDHNAYPPAAANPRTWVDYAIPWLAASEAAGLNKTKVALGLAGCVGETGATMLMSDMKTGGNTMELIDDPRKIRKALKDKEPDVVHNFLGAVNQFWADETIDDAKVAGIYDACIKADLKADVIYGKFSEIAVAKTRTGKELGVYVKDAISKAVQARF